MKILGIETSCDETAVGIVKDRNILANVISSQIEIHAPFGGVVPEIASRHHVENLPMVLDQALQQAGVTLQEIDGIAATYSPGLLGCLLIGLQFGKALAFSLGKPFYGINHLEGHLQSVFLENKTASYPFLGLIASGGHTHLYLVKEFGKYERLGATRDDACGEAFDKVAKLLGLGYPGGPAIEKIAKNGDPHVFTFTFPKTKGDLFDFSFSGIKTACLLAVKQQPKKLSKAFIADLSASFQEAATGFLMRRLREASKKTGVETIVVTGGVAANQHLRKKLSAWEAEENIRCFVPSPKLCTDNGAMIAYVGGLHARQKQTSPLSLNALAYSEL